MRLPCITDNYDLFTLKPTSGSDFDEIRFSAQGSSDDFLINKVFYETTVPSNVLSADETLSVDIELISITAQELSGLVLSGLPAGVVLTDGTHNFIAGSGLAVSYGSFTGPSDSVDIKTWDLDNLVLSAPSDLAATDFNITILATAQDTLKGDAEVVFGIDTNGNSSLETTGYDNDPDMHTATSIDGVMEGLIYKTSSGLTGATDENGQFSYYAGDSVTFYIGSVIIGSAMADDLADGKVFLQELADIALTNLNDEYVENMAVFLQSLDLDDNPENNITITQEMHDKFDGVDLDLRNASEEDIRQAIENVGETAVSEDEAMQHVKDMLIEYAGMSSTEFDERVMDDVEYDFSAIDALSKVEAPLENSVESLISTEELLSEEQMDLDLPNNHVEALDSVNNNLTPEAMNSFEFGPVAMPSDEEQAIIDSTLNQTHQDN